MNSRNISYGRTFWRILRKHMIHENLMTDVILWWFTIWFNNFAFGQCLTGIPMRLQFDLTTLHLVNVCLVYLWDAFKRIELNEKILLLWQYCICDHISPIGKIMCYDSSKSALSTFIPSSLSGCTQEKWRYQWKWWFSQGVRDNIARLAHIQWLLEPFRTHQCPHTPMQDGWYVDRKTLFHCIPIPISYD
jgi:hypothetical protein